jgi:hypothetical protein
VLLTCSTIIDSKGPDRFIRGHLGSQFPEDAKIIDWVGHGVQTYLPFILEDKPPYRVRRLHHQLQPPSNWDFFQDFNVVRLLSSVPNACTLQRTPPLATVLPASNSLNNDIKLVTAVRKALSEGTSVVVKGWHPRLLRQFSIEAFEMAGFSGDQKIVCHSELPLQMLQLGKLNFLQQMPRHVLRKGQTSLTKPTSSRTSSLELRTHQPAKIFWTCPCLTWNYLTG